MKKYIFTESEFLRLKAEKASNPETTIADFSRRTGINPGTVSRAIRASEFNGQVIEMFPMMRIKQAEARRRTAEMQKVSASDVGKLNVDVSLLHVRAAVMDWRKAA